MACMLMTAQGGRADAKLHASVSYRGSSLLRAVGGLYVITSLCIQQTVTEKQFFSEVGELMHQKGKE